MTICVKLLNSSIRFYLLIRSFSIRKFLKSVKSFHSALEATAMCFLWGRFPFSIQFLSIMRSAAFFWCSTSCSQISLVQWTRYFFLPYLFIWVTWSQSSTWSSVCGTVDRQSAWGIFFPASCLISESNCPSFSIHRANNPSGSLKLYNHVRALWSVTIKNFCPRR